FRHPQRQALRSKRARRDIGRRWRCGAMTLRLAAVLMVLGAVLSSSASASSVTCSVTYGPAANSVEHEHWYPSGRRPSPDTCRTITVQGQIQAGDARRLAQLLRQNHPFVNVVSLV